MANVHELSGVVFLAVTRMNDMGRSVHAGDRVKGGQERELHDRIIVDDAQGSRDAVADVRELCGVVLPAAPLSFPEERAS